MVDRYEYNPDNEVQFYLVRYCFAPILQRELDETKEYWNNHRIRQSSFATVSGRPNVLYSVPEDYNATECLQLYDMSDFDFIVDFAESEANQEIPEFIPSQYLIQFNRARLSLNHTFDSSSWEDCLNLYILLRDSLSCAVRIKVLLFLIKGLFCSSHVHMNVNFWTDLWNLISLGLEWFFTRNFYRNYRTQAQKK